LLCVRWRLSYTYSLQVRKEGRIYVEKLMITIIHSRRSLIELGVDLMQIILNGLVLNRSIVKRKRNPSNT